MGDVTGFPLWGTLTIATAMAIIAVLAIMRYGLRQGLTIIAAMVLVFGLAAFALERYDMQSKAEQRRAMEARVGALNAQALLPNSSLACLDAVGGDLVHEACERALFAGPEQIAAALNYVGARLDVLRDIAALPRREQAAYARLLTPMLRSLESDRFGLVAQVLMARDECKPSSCYVFAFLKRRDQIVANMNENAYDARVTRFAANWGEKPAAANNPALAAQAEAPEPAAPPHSPVNIDFPTAASIPPVSIMANEPGRPGQNGVGELPKPEARAEPRPEPRAEPRPQPSPPPRRAQKAQAPRSAPPEPAVADPFPQPVRPATPATPTTTGAQQ